LRERLKGKITTIEKFWRTHHVAAPPEKAACRLQEA
jgi:hypothetical protein